MLHISVVQLMDVSVDESNWSLQRITVNMLLGKKKVFTEWMPSSLKTSLNATYLHYQSISLMFVVSCPSDWNKPNCSPVDFNKFTWETAVFERCSVLFLLEKHGTEFSLISSSYQVTAHRKRGNMLTKSGAMWDTVHGITFIQQFQWNKPNSAWICCAARVEIHLNCKMLFWGTYFFFLALSCVLLSVSFSLSCLSWTLTPLLPPPVPTPYISIPEENTSPLLSL